MNLSLKWLYSLKDFDYFIHYLSLADSRIWFHHTSLDLMQLLMELNCSGKVIHILLMEHLSFLFLLHTSLIFILFIIELFCFFHLILIFQTLSICLSLRLLSQEICHLNLFHFQKILYVYLILFILKNLCIHLNLI